MCGIIGALAYGEFDTKIMETARQEAIIFLVSELLQLTESRGKDATGLATLFKNCDYMALKMGISATEFVSRFGAEETDFSGFLNVWRKVRTDAKVVIGHCRKPSLNTDAGPEDNRNNHPIKVESIVGVHNGTLTNHSKIIQNLNYKSDGKVDSEAIFSLLNFYTQQGKEPFSLELLKKTCERLQGSFACLAFSNNNPYQMVAFRDGRPMELVVIKPLKLVLIASEKVFIKSVIFRYNRFVQLYNMGPKALPPLCKTDVEMITMPDKNAFLFDVRKDITKDTKAEDLFMSEIIPATGKLWGNDPVVNPNIYGNNRYNGQQAAKARVGFNNPHVPVVIPKSPIITEKKTGPSSKTGTSESVKDKLIERIGMAWNRQRTKYESVDKEKKTEKHGFVEMSEKTHEIIDVLTGDVLMENNTEFILKKTKNILTKEKKSDLTIINEVKTMVKSDEVKPEVSVDIKVYPEVTRMSADVSDDLTNFLDNIQVCGALGIENVVLLESMTTYCLINRARKSFYQDGWYAGYIKCMEDNKVQNTKTSTVSIDNIGKLQRNFLQRSKEKQQSIQRSIKMTKAIVRLLGKMNHDFPKEEMEIIVAKAFESGERFDIEAMKKVFRAGDLRKSPLLKNTFQVIENLQKEEGNDIHGS